MAKIDLCVVYWVFNWGAFWFSNDWRVSIWFHGWIGVSTRWPAPLKRHRRNGLPFTDWVILFVGTEEECRCIEWLLRPRRLMGWNKACGGSLNRLGVATSEKTKKLLSDINKNRPPDSPETREKKRIVSTGRTNRGRVGQKKPDEERLKISLTRKSLDLKLSPKHNAALQAARLPAAHAGHHHSDKTKKEISGKKSGVPIHSEEHKQQLAERMKSNNYTKGKPWSAARRLAWLQTKERDHADLVCADQLGLFTE